MNIPLFSSISPLAALIAASTALAAPITWTVHDITGNVSDISTIGTLVDARAGADYGTQDVVDGTTFHVNGVPFDDDHTLDDPTNHDTIQKRAGAGIIDDYYTLLRIGDRKITGDASITFDGLDIGTTYQIQIWCSDNTSTLQDMSVVLNNGTEAAPTYGAPGHVTLLSEVSDGGPGQYAIGMFTAGGTSQSFKLRLWKNLTTSPIAAENTFINAVQLRALGKGTHANQPGLTTAETTTAPTAPASPMLVQLRSTETTMTLEFNQPMNRASATNADNYTVSLKGGGTGSIANASLSGDGRTVTLTLGLPLISDGSTYIIQFGELTGANDKLLAGNRAVEFRP